MSKVQSSVDLSAFPKQFVTSLRILFDILDEDRTGFVRLCDIESRWNEDGVKGLPSGVVEALRKVTPESGCLTFELFVSGLKMALLKNNLSSQGKENRGLITDKSVERSKPRPNSAVLAQASGPQMRPHSEKQFHQGHHNLRNSAPTTATVRPNNVLNSASNPEPREQVYHSRDQTLQVRPKSAVDNKYRSQDKNIPNQPSQSRSNTTPKDSVYQSRNEYSKTRQTSTASYQSREQVHAVDIPPPRPPPYMPPASDPKIPPTVPPRDKSRMVLAELKNWQREMHVGGSYPATKDPKLLTTNSDSKLMERNHGNEIYVNIEQLRQHAGSPPTVTSVTSSHAPKVGVRRQNSRRHTLSSGVDYNMLKRMKQLEQEKDLLLQGLEVVERTRDWYHRQILVVSEKQKALGRTSYSDYNLEANQERMNFQRARIVEVNQNLCTLIESTEKKRQMTNNYTRLLKIKVRGFPIHMNLAIQTNPTYSDEATIRMLKDQNKQLTEEVSNKNDRITQLEQEKGSLIRELFDSRSKNKSNYDDTTFM